MLLEGHVCLQGRVTTTLQSFPQIVPGAICTTRTMDILVTQGQDGLALSPATVTLKQLCRYSLGHTLSGLAKAGAR